MTSYAPQPMPKKNSLLGKSLGKTLPPELQLKFYRTLDQPLLLARVADPWEFGANKLVPRSGTDKASEQESKRRLKVLRGERGDDLTVSLNNYLVGHSSFPMANGIASVLMGTISGVGGVLYSLITAAMSQAQITPRVLARPGDEIWQVELVGKTAGMAEMVHAEYWFLVDPFRDIERKVGVGWLIHERRQLLTSG